MSAGEPSPIRGLKEVYSFLRDLPKHAPCEFPRVDARGLDWKAFAGHRHLRGNPVLLSGLLAREGDDTTGLKAGLGKGEENPWLMKETAAASKQSSTRQAFWGEPFITDPSGGRMRAWLLAHYGNMTFLPGRTSRGGERKQGPRRTALISYMSLEASELGLFDADLELPPHRDLALAVAKPLRALFEDFVARPILNLGVRASGNEGHAHDETWLALLSGRKAWWIAESSGGEAEPAALHGRGSEVATVSKGRVNGERFSGWRDPCGALHVGKEKRLGVLFCLQEAGEVVYFGPKTEHAVCNLDPTVVGVGAQGSTEGWPEVLRATHRGDATAVRLAVAKPDAVTTLRNGHTALHRAALFGFLPVVEALLGMATTSTSSTDLGEPRKAWGTQRLPVKTDASLLRAAADGARPLHLAAKHGHIEVVQTLLLMDGVEAQARDSSGADPLHLAAGGGYVPMVEFLVLHAGVVSRSKDNRGGRPLHIAAASGHVAVTEILLKFNEEERRGEASFGGLSHEKLDQGVAAQEEDADSEGSLPLHTAAGNGYLSVVELLLKGRDGAAVSAVDIRGGRPLHSAAAAGHLEVVTFLAAQDHEGSASSSSHVVAADLAVSAGHMAVADFLESRRGVSQKEVEKGELLFEPQVKITEGNYDTFPNGEGASRAGAKEMNDYRASIMGSKGFMRLEIRGGPAALNGKYIYASESFIAGQGFSDVQLSQDAFGGRPVYWRPAGKRLPHPHQATDALSRTDAEKELLSQVAPSFVDEEMWAYYMPTFGGWCLGKLLGSDDVDAFLPDAAPGERPIWQVALGAGDDLEPDPKMASAWYREAGGANFRAQVEL